MTFLYKFWKKARVYYTLSISRGGVQAPGPPPGFATAYMTSCDNSLEAPALSNALGITIQIQLQQSYMLYNNNTNVHYR